MSAPGIPPGYRDLMRRAAGDGLPFEPTGDERRLARELADAGLIRVHAYSDGSGEEVQGITVKGREWLESMNRARWAGFLAILRELLILAVGATFGALASRYITPSVKCDSPCVCESHPVCQTPDEKSNGEEDCGVGDLPP